MCPSCSRAGAVRPPTGSRRALRSCAMSDATHGIPPAPPVEGAVHLHSGKVRDLYRSGDGRLLMVASDRISAYDFVLDSTIPDKGAVLTQMSLWWFEQLADLVPDHVLSTDVPASVRGRAVVCESLEMYPGRVRGPRLPHRLGAAGLPARRGEVCGVALPPGSRTAAGCPQPIFTPATKAAVGRARRERLLRRRGALGRARTSADQLRDLTLAVYRRAEEIARERGIMLADTKLEFGARADGTVVLADEVLTPDSSRFWPADDWQPGRRPAVLRQADRPRLAASPRPRLGPPLGRAAAAAARGGGRAHPGALRRGVRAADRPEVPGLTGRRLLASAHRAHAPARANQESPWPVSSSTSCSSPRSSTRRARRCTVRCPGSASTGSARSARASVRARGGR